MVRYCDGKQKTKVTLSIGQQKLNLEFPPGVDIQINPVFSIVVIRNQGLCNDAWYEGFFCGSRVQIFSGGIICGNPSVDFSILDSNGNIKFTTGTPSANSGARAGTLSWSAVETVKPTPGFISSNFATNCEENGYKFEVYDGNGNLIYSQIFAEKPDYTVACDDDCPPNHIKCNCPGYPGYCCIPCSEIRNGIAAVTATVRSLNNG